MLETIRKKVMVRIQENNTKVDRWGTMICPNILKKVNAISLSLDIVMQFAMGLSALKWRIGITDSQSICWRKLVLVGTSNVRFAMSTCKKSHLF